jgi:hypothetical protein
MPSSSPKQQRFFKAVQNAKHNPNYGDARLHKVANSMTDKDIHDFASSIAELRTKKALLSILKDAIEPMYLDEANEGQINPVTKEFHIKDDFQSYIKKYLGQPLSPKEMEAVNTLKEVKPTKVERTELWYETSDDFKNSTTTVIKKMKDGSQFSFNAFQKYTSAQPEEPEQPEQPMMGGPESVPGQPAIPGTPTPENPEQPTNQPETEPTEPEQPETPEKDDIIVTKSVLFNDEIKGGAILSEFLKKLDL